MADNYLTVDHLTTKDLIRIFSKLCIDPVVNWNSSPCWVWTGARAAGYSNIRWNGTVIHAHRLIFAWLVHPLPKGRKNGELDHLCKNPPCCNPVHLEFVPHRINVLRSNAPMAKQAMQTHCKRGHELFGDNLYIDPPNHRECRTCARNRKWPPKDPEKVRAYNKLRWQKELQKRASLTKKPSTTWR